MTENPGDLIEGGKYRITGTGMTSHIDAEGRMVKSGWVRVEPV